MASVRDDDAETLIFADESGSPDDRYQSCDHDHDENCEITCTHQHCFSCAGCNCPGYCDDYLTYNLRPDETGGAVA